MEINIYAAILTYRLDEVPSSQTQNMWLKVWFSGKEKTHHLTCIYMTYVRTFEQAEEKRRASSPT